MIVQYFPILRWLPSYQRRWWRGDIIAGLSVWALTVTHALTFASFLGIPVQTGLYAALAGLTLNAVFSSSRHIITAPSVTIVSVTSGAIVLAGIQRPLEIVGFTTAIALMAGLIYLLLWIFRMGWLASLLPGNVLTGFISGLAITIGLGQIRQAFDISDSGLGAVVEMGVETLQNPQSALLTFLLAAGTTALLIGLKKYVPKIPPVLVVLFVSIILSSIIDWQALGVATVGPIPPGLPSISIPAFSLSQLGIILLSAVAVVFVGFVETDSSARLSADKYFEPIDVNQELLAQSATNIGSSLLSGFGVDGTLSKTLSNMNNGANTQMASLVQAALVLLTLLYLGPLLSGMPWAILGTIVFITVITLIRIQEFRRLYRLNKFEFWQTVLTALIFVLIGPLLGVMVGALTSILVQTRRAANPDIVVLGRRRGNNSYVDSADPSDLETFPGLVILRLHGPLYFATANALRNYIWIMTKDDTLPVQAIILDFGMTYYADLEGTDVLLSVKRGLDIKHIKLLLAEMHQEVLHFLESTGVDLIIDSANIYQSVDDAVQAYLHEGENSPAAKV